MGLNTEGIFENKCKMLSWIKGDIFLQGPFSTKILLQNSMSYQKLYRQENKQTKKECEISEKEKLEE